MTFEIRKLRYVIFWNCKT